MITLRVRRSCQRATGFSVCQVGFWVLNSPYSSPKKISWNHGQLDMEFVWWNKLSYSVDSRNAIINMMIMMILEACKCWMFSWAKRQRGEVVCFKILFFGWGASPIIMEESKHDTLVVANPLLVTVTTRINTSQPPLLGFAESIIRYIRCGWNKWNWWWTMVMIYRGIK